jgi:hypothetical protein
MIVKFITLIILMFNVLLVSSTLLGTEKKISDLEPNQIQETTRNVKFRDDANGDWLEQEVILFNTTEAEVMIRVGDIDNLGFGWEAGFNPFSGNSTPGHSFPWAVHPDDHNGTDRIMVVSSYNGNPPHGNDGYTATTSRPENLPREITMHYNLLGTSVHSAALQIFVDDFQAPVWWANYEVYINGTRAVFMEPLINSLVQTGPIGKLISIQIPVDYIYLVEQDSLSILFDDNSTGAGDGYAIDFVKLLINPGAYSYTGTIQGNVTDIDTSFPIEGVLITAASIVSDYSNDAGDYELLAVPAGLVFIEASKQGYQTETFFVNLVADDTETLPIQLQKKPAIPVSISIEIFDNVVYITWDEIMEASAYKVYSANSPDDEFTEDSSGIFLENSWSAPIISNQKFYYVTAIK